jgi:hypothetical protein
MALQKFRNNNFYLQVLYFVNLLRKLLRTILCLQRPYVLSVCMWRGGGAGGKIGSVRGVY